MPSEDRKQARLARKVARADKQNNISVETNRPSKDIESGIVKNPNAQLTRTSKYNASGENIGYEDVLAKGDMGTNTAPVDVIEKPIATAPEAPSPSILSDIVSVKPTDTQIVNPEKQIEPSPTVVSANIAKDEINKSVDTTTTVGNTILENVLSNPKATTTEIEQAKILKEAADKEEEKLKAEETNIATKAVDEVSSIPGDGSMVSNVVSTGVSPSALPAYDATATKQNVEQDIVKDVRTRVSEIPEAVVERLGVQDYYPNINKDINVGTYSGKYIGSVPIFAAPGARLPMGLYDARKRALVEAAKAKQAKIDALMDVPETSFQYDAKFRELATNTTFDILEKHNFDPDAVMRDRESVAKLNRIQAKAKEVTGAVAWANDIKTKSTDEKTYQPDEVIELAQKVLSGQIDNFDDIYEGKSNMTSLFNDAKVYINGVPWITKQAEFMLDPKNMSESPINLKTGGEYSSQKWIDERDAFLQQVQDGNTDTDTYVTGVNKYFGGKYKDMVDAWIESNNASKEQGENLKKIFASKIQESTILSYKTSKNANQWQSNLAQRNKEFEYTKKTNEASLFGKFDGQMTDAINDKTKKSFQQEINEIDPNLSLKEKEAKISRIAQIYFPGTDVGKDLKTGAVSSYIPNYNAKMETKSTVGKDGKAIRQFQVQVYQNKKWVDMNLSADKIANSKSQIRSLGSTKVFTPTDKINFSKVSPGSISMKVVRTELIPSFVDKNGVTQYLKADGSNLAQYNSTPKEYRRTTGRDIGKAYVVVPSSPIGGNAITYTEVELPGEIVSEVTNISNAGSAANKDIEYGYKAMQSAESFGGLGNEDISSGSGGYTYE